MAESLLLADRANQHSASVKFVSAREDHSSTGARAPNTFLSTGGEERKEGGQIGGAEEREAGMSKRGSSPRWLARVQYSHTGVKRGGGVDAKTEK